MDLGGYLQIASAIVALAGIGGFAVVRESLTQVREQNKDLRDEVADHRRRQDDNEATIADLGTKLDALRGVVTGEVHWVAISDLLETHHKLTEEHWRETKGLLGDIRDERRS